MASWEIYRGDRALTGVAREALLGDELELVWTFATSDAVISSPVISEGRVYVGSSDGHLACIDLEQGTSIWKKKTEDMVEAPPLVLRGRVYVGSTDFNFYCLDARTGEVLFTKETGDKIVGSANWFSTPQGELRVVVGSYDAELHCFDAVTGKSVWTYTTEHHINGSPSISENRIVFGGCDAHLHIVSTETGQALDKISLGRECQVASSVVLSGDRAFFGHLGGRFLCVDLKTKEDVWSHEGQGQPFPGSASVDGDTVVFGGKDKYLYCVDAHDGSLRWSFPTRRGIDASPVISKDRVVFGSGDGRLYLLRRSDGKELWQYEIGRPLSSSPAVSGRWVIIGCNDGKVYAFRSKPAR